MKAKVKDIKGHESNWAQLQVTMPRETMYNPAVFFTLIERLMKPYPYTNPDTTTIARL